MVDVSLWCGEDEAPLEEVEVGDRPLGVVDGFLVVTSL